MGQTEQLKENMVTTQRKKGNLVFLLLVRLIREKPLGTVGALLVLVLFLAGIFSEFLAPYGMNEYHLIDRMKPPSDSYVLGTDHLGRDLLSRIIFGARVSMLVGLAASSISAAISTLIGLASGYLGGKFDLIVQRFVDAWICFPAVVIYLTLMSIIGSGILQIVILLGIGSGIEGSRLIRSATLSLKSNVFVEAAHAIGSSTWRVLLRHLLPNIVPVIIIRMTLGMATVILAEATLSFLGFGIPPPFPSWGQMLSGRSRMYMLDAPWMALWPGLALTLAVYGINMFGDALRDLLDPRLRGGVGGMGGYGIEQARKALRKKGGGTRESD
jgi:peptide/nickel transport system permease protein